MDHMFSGSPLSSASGQLRPAGDPREGKKTSWRAGPLVSSLWGLRGSCPGSPSLPIIITAPSSWRSDLLRALLVRGQLCCLRCCVHASPPFWPHSCQQPLINSSSVTHQSEPAVSYGDSGGHQALGRPLPLRKHFPSDSLINAPSDPVNREGRVAPPTVF